MLLWSTFTPIASILLLTAHHVCQILKLSTLKLLDFELLRFYSQVDSYSINSYQHYGWFVAVFQSIRTQITEWKEYNSVIIIARFTCNIPRSSSHEAKTSSVNYYSLVDDVISGSVRMRSRARDVVLFCSVSCLVTQLSCYNLHDWLVIKFWRRGWDPFRIRSDTWPFLFVTIRTYTIYYLYITYICTYTYSVFGASIHSRSVGESDPSTQTLIAYFERLEQFFEANSISHYPADATVAVIQAANRKKVAVMISVIGKNTYGTLRDLCSPENPKDKTSEVLRGLLQRHLKGTPSRYSACTKLWLSDRISRIQKMRGE